MPVPGCKNTHTHTRTDTQTHTGQRVPGRPEAAHTKGRSRRGVYFIDFRSEALAGSAVIDVSPSSGRIPLGHFLLPARE